MDKYSMIVRKENGQWIVDQDSIHLLEKLNTECPTVELLISHMTPTDAIIEKDKENKDMYGEEYVCIKCKKDWDIGICWNCYIEMQDSQAQSIRDLHRRLNTIIDNSSKIDVDIVLIERIYELKLEVNAMDIERKELKEEIRKLKNRLDDIFT